MKLVGVVIFLSLSISTYATNYVVIGAFAKKSNAVKLAKKTEASFDLNAVKQLYYVFVLKTDDHEAAFAEARRLQSDSEYKDAWVFAGTLGEGGSGEDIMVPVKVEESITFTQEPIVADTDSNKRAGRAGR